MQVASREEQALKNKFMQAWKTLPSALRKTIALVIGLTLIITGLLLIVLPGPFTMPLLVLGLVVLALEFAWAEAMLIRVRHHGAKLNPKKLFGKKEL
jgi:hypothetical protein